MKKRRNNLYGKKVIVPIMDVTDALNKKGKLKGRNKKQTKILRASCVHHRYTKKGTIKPTTKRVGSSIICTACETEIPKRFFDNDQVKDVCKDLKEIVEQGKYLSVACNTSNQTINYFSRFAVELKMLPKAYKRLAEIANNRGKIKKKKSDVSGSRQYGAWK